MKGFTEYLCCVGVGDILVNQPKVPVANPDMNPAELLINLVKQHEWTTRNEPARLEETDIYAMPKVTKSSTRLMCASIEATMYMVRMNYRGWLRKCIIRLPRVAREVSGCEGGWGKLGKHFSTRKESKTGAIDLTVHWVSSNSEGYSGDDMSGNGSTYHSATESESERAVVMSDHDIDIDMKVDDSESTSFETFCNKTWCDRRGMYI